MSNHIKTSEGSTWPLPDREDDDRPLAWALTYAEPTREELLRAVSIIRAYSYLVTETTTRRRNAIVRDIRHHTTLDALDALRDEHATDGELA